MSRWREGHPASGQTNSPASREHKAVKAGPCYLKAEAPHNWCKQHHQGGNMSPVQGTPYEEFSRYVMTHCTTCAAGWIRNGEFGRLSIVCLLDREPVWADMTACDRFERQSPPGN
jgi:hypothetical protein